MIGCGGFAQLCHGPSQRRIAESDPDVEWVACCDTDPVRAQAYARSFGFKRSYSDSLAMLSTEKPDAVIVAVPPSVTCGAVVPLLERGLRVLLEKPPGLTTAELGRLIAAATAGGAQAQVAFNRRRMPVLRKAREILDAEFSLAAVGRLDYEMVRCNRWDEDFSTTAIHAFDAALFLARSPVLDAEFRFQDQTGGGCLAANVVMSATCASGLPIQVTIQPVTGRNAESARLSSVGRTLIVKVPASPVTEELAALELWRDNVRVDAFVDDARDTGERFGVLGETEDFLRAVRYGGAFTPSLQECRQQVALMEAMRRRQSGPIRFT
jgi:myo-inositol 2-dehydrogenase / D-chiro-inositol 1-dehydrogenase